MNVSISSSGNWMSTGFVDPTVEIDPTFADVSQYELLFSPDVGNAPLPSRREPLERSVNVKRYGFLWLAVASGSAVTAKVTGRPFS